VSTSKLFLLSPAFCGGRRATYLLRDGSQLALAKRLADNALTLGEAFSFMSGLYFRGKLAYATHFAQMAPRGERSLSQAVLVITPTRGLQSPDLTVTAELLREFATVDVKADDARYRKPLDRDLQALSRVLSANTRIVLLGSIATGKYVDALTRAFGARLHYPSAFVGRGDMSRGGLLLRSVASGTELDYTPLTSDVSRHGPRPPKLTPLARRPQPNP
jgi:hypothetical protein